MNDNKLTAVVLLDMSKAFDTVDHHILISKLKDVGVSTEALKWFTSYLTNRSQRVRINSTLSDALDVFTGVPQGSILGPVLFSIYTVGTIYLQYPLNVQLNVMLMTQKCSSVSQLGIMT